MSGRTMDDLLFLTEVATLTRSNVGSVRQWIRQGRLPSVRPGRYRMVRRADLEQFMSAVSPSHVVVVHGTVEGAEDFACATCGAPCTGARAKWRLVLTIPRGSREVATVDTCGQCAAELARGFGVSMRRQP